jgi:hypothetical protein
MQWATVQLNDHRVLVELLEADGAFASGCEWIFASAWVDQVCRSALKGGWLAEAVVRGLPCLVHFLLIVGMAALVMI